MEYEHCVALANVCLMATRRFGMQTQADKNS